MKLARRVSFIVVPATAVVLLVISYLTWSLLQEQVKENELATTHLEFENALVDLERTILGAEVLLVEATKHQRLFAEYLTSTKHFQAYTLNTAYLDLAYQASKAISGFRAIAALNADDETIIKVDIEQLRAFDLTEHPLSELEQNAYAQLKAYLLRTGSTKGFITFSTGDRIELMVVEIFSPSVREGDTAIWSSDHFALVLIVNPQLLNALIVDDRIKFETLGPSKFSLGFADQSVLIEETDEEIGLTLETSLYRVTKHISLADISQAMESITSSIFLVFIAALVILYTVIGRLLRNQILQPISALAELIQKSIQQGRVMLSPRIETNEIDALNNQYVGLMEQIQELANRDELTKLPNRAEFVRLIEAEIEMNPNNRYGLLYLDLDRFKQVNDYYGHDEGDKLLVRFAQQLEQAVELFLDRRGGTVTQKRKFVSRLSGDEFALFVAESEENGSSIELAMDLLEKFGVGYETEHGVLHVGVSVGISSYPLDAQDAESLLTCADEAMFEAKSNGRNRFELYGVEIQQINASKRTMQRSLVESFDSDSFYLAFQPIYRSTDLKIKGAEVLLRSRHPELEKAGTQAFIRVAETNGSIIQVDKWVIQTAMARLTEIQKIRPGFFFAINFSAAELVASGFVDLVAEGIIENNLDPTLIELEITETRLIDLGEQASHTLTELGKLGVSISLDDFGTGYNSFSRLNNPAIKKLKIDRSFVNALSTSDADANMVEIILGVARLYDLSVVAEGVETQTQMEFLRDEQCHQLQGYLLSKPLAWHKLIALLDSSD